jgi:molybdate transport repressor ModE-like protein
MPTIATSSTPPPLSIRWSWDLGLGLSTAESTALLGLLAALREHGTLGQAATAANTSYRAAWGLLRKCEQALGKALVIKAPGKGTQLSAFAEQLLQLDGVARSTLQEIHAPWGQRLQELLSPSETAEPERLRIAASHDLALADWIENGRHITVDIFWRGSEEALLALARGECDAAGFHLLKQTEAETLEQFAGFTDRQAHDPGIAAGQMLDEHPGAALDAVGAGLVHRFAAHHVMADFVVVDCGKRTSLEDRTNSVRPIVVDRDTGQNAMRLARTDRAGWRLHRPSTGLPMISPANSSVVSADSTGRIGQARSSTIFWPCSALARATRST